MAEHSVLHVKENFQLIDILILQSEMLRMPPHRNGTTLAEECLESPQKFLEIPSSALAKIHLTFCFLSPGQQLKQQF